MNRKTNELSYELKRAFGGVTFKIAIIMGLAVTVGHFFIIVIPKYSNASTSNYQTTLFNSWIGQDSISVFSFIYYMLFPILCAIPYSWSFINDSKNGYVRQLLVRCRKKELLVNRYIAVFSSGGCVTIIPLLVNFFLTAAVLPSLRPQASTFYFAIYSSSFMGDFFYIHPWLYTWIYFGLNFCFAGFLATLSLAVSSYVEHTLTVLLFPTMVYLFTFSLTLITNLEKICPFYFLRMDQPIETDLLIVILEMIFMLLTGLFYFYENIKKTIW